MGKSVALDFKFPDVGEGITEGELLKWLVKEGDLVKQDQAIAEVETDKAVVELPSPLAGVIIKLHVAAGTKIKVGQVIATIGTTGEKTDSQTQKKEKTNSDFSASKKTEEKKPVLIQPAKKMEAPIISKPNVEPQKPIQASTEADSSKLIHSLPHTRRLAQTLGIDLAKISGSGPGGRITDEDVQNFSKQKTIPNEGYAPTKPSGVVSEEKHGTEERIPLRGIRKTIADKLSQSYHTAVHVSTMDEIEVSELVRVREKEKVPANEHGIHLTFLPFIIKAAVVALQKYPMFNSSLDDDKSEIILKHYYNIGIAVDTDDGLMVPVIKNADQKSMFELAIEIQDLSKSARERKIAIDDLKGSSFSITNYGSVGAQYATPIINYPNVAILGVGKIVQKPVVKNGQVAVGLVLPLTFTFDHRIADGAMASAFLNTVLKLLADPDFLLVETR